MNWKKIIAMSCLFTCILAGIVTENQHICAAQKALSEEKGLDSTEEQGKTETGGTGGFVIDNQNVYDGMANSYSRGYTPQTDGKKAVVVLPLVAKRRMSGDRITVTLRFGEADTLPFVQKNYEKAVSFGQHRTVNPAGSSGCYLVSFSLELKRERYNGNYPVMLSVSAEDMEGNEISQEFTIYVTISDGKEMGAQDKSGASESGGSAVFSIDNKHVYRGMGKSYAHGYVPKTYGDRAVLVLPLLAKRSLAGSKLTAALKLGESENQPFVQKNYEKTVKKRKNSSCYLISYNLKLKKKRYNGSYPVTVTVSAEEQNGTEISQEFTVYVTITDGRGIQGDSRREENQPQPAPKVQIASWNFSKEKILCGEKFKAKLTLRNTSRTEAVRNMMVTVSPGENVELLGKADSVYVEQLAAGRNCEVSFDFRVSADAPRGQYNIEAKLEYADSKGTSYDVQGAVKVSAEQNVRIGIDPVQVPKEIQLGDTVILKMQAMNLGRGRLYNVRAALEAEGLTSSGSAYMGDAEAGTALAGTLEVTAEGLTGDSIYGSTRGKVVFYYEDEMGNEITEEQTFETSIFSPLREEQNDTPVDNTGQWWVIMAILTASLAAAAAVFLVRKKRQAQKEEGVADEK